MTKSSTLRCAWCGDRFKPPGGPGRPPKYCRRSHRQRAYESRQIAADRGLGVDEVLLTSDAWQAIRDALFQIEAAAQDALTDLAVVDTVADARAVVEELSGAIRTAASVTLEPKAVGS